MDKDLKKVTEEEINDISTEDLIDLKVEAEDLIEDLDEVIARCDKILNS